LFGEEEIPSIFQISPVPAASMHPARLQGGQGAIEQIFRDSERTRSQAFVNLNPENVTTMLSPSSVTRTSSAACIRSRSASSMAMQMSGML